MSDAKKIIIARGIRGLADGLVSIALASYLTELDVRRYQLGIPTWRPWEASSRSSARPWCR
jgi:hypothetical protein